MKAYCNNRKTERREFWQLPEPMVLEPDDVKIKVKYAMFGPEDMQIHDKSSFYSRDGVICIEMSGVITDLGTQAKLDGFAVGDEVTGLPFRFCRTCRACRNGRQSCCVNPVFAGGTMCEYIVWKSSQLVVLNGKIGMREAPLIHTVAEALEVIERGAVDPRCRVAIWGGNYMALLLTRLSRLYGAQEVVVIDDQKERRALALEMGADKVLHPQDEDFELSMHRISDFSGYETVFEASGLSGSISHCLEYMAKGGNLVLINCVDFHIRSTMIMDTAAFFLGNYNISSVFASNAKLDIALQIANKLELSKLISFEVPLDSIASAFERYDSAKHHKVLVRIS